MFSLESKNRHEEDILKLLRCSIAIALAFFILRLQTTMTVMSQSKKVGNFLIIFSKVVLLLFLVLRVCRTHTFKHLIQR